MEETQKLTVRTSPSLALVKYWGKSDTEQNTPATSSLAITLNGLYTETNIALSDSQDRVSVGGTIQPEERYRAVFQKIRTELNSEAHFQIESDSNFPASAGLASSSSGFAALAYGCAKLIDPKTEMETIGEIARLGSASASRALFGGFTILKRDALRAEPLADKTFWPELKVIVAIVKNAAKKIGSRAAMQRAKESSPYYPVWIEESEEIFNQALTAFKDRDLNKLGPLMQKSYLMMFSTMFTSTPPANYWEADSVRLLQTCQKFRELGFTAWETMDAGPQVKIFTLQNESPLILAKLQEEFPHLTFLVADAGDGPKILNQEFNRQP